MASGTPTGATNSRGLTGELIAFGKDVSQMEPAQAGVSLLVVAAIAFIAIPVIIGVIAILFTAGVLASASLTGAIIIVATHNVTLAVLAVALVCLAGYCWWNH
jgi:hypothetical protein